MLNRLNKFRLPSREKVDFVLSKAILWIEAGFVMSACQFEIRTDGKSFAWIYGSEELDSDPLIPKTIWGLNGSELLYVVLLIQMK